MFLESVKCNFTEPPGAPCFGAEGQMLIFHLPSTANTSIRLRKDSKEIVLKTSKDKTVTFHGEFVNQTELFTNGTWKLGTATKRHSGDYMLEEFGYAGDSVKKVTVHLEIQGKFWMFFKTKIASNFDCGFKYIYCGC